MQFIKWVLISGMAVGGGYKLAHLTFDMAKSAVNAHQHDQMSYAKFTKALLAAKTRSK